ncbi:SNARE-interacting protein KEULE [Camellia lanceoleosa]|uniref:SNARE-interacting protein KEULE n=1 Tax=Camellia lanceoleosa TaxID=1840588 RepID=A0ACC0I3N0_9ERIC|nr:SNARE-interacting protein KEULE [Camellia lanceoleosa]
MTKSLVQIGIVEGDLVKRSLSFRSNEEYMSMFLNEFPLVRYHAAKSLDPTTMTTFRDLIPTKLVTIAPVIHEWTYDAICHDLLNMEGNKYVHESLPNNRDMEARNTLFANGRT